MGLRAATFAVLLLATMAGGVRAEVDFARDIKPIFASHCTVCHGAIKQKAGLRLDAGPLVAKGGKDGAIVAAGKSNESLLVHALTGTNGASQMPEEGEPLKPDQIALIKQWIDEGAKTPDEPIPAGPEAHWAFNPPVRPAVPAVKNAAWVKNPIDAFIAAQHETKNLTPRPEAEKHTLLRRITLDLTGLPPTPEELKAFLSDGSPDAYEKVVDRLLASPRYGERWGRHWMDVWRYSDWAGYKKEIRLSQPHIWRWRDWIIESLNADKPYDRMVTEMLAGDEIAPTDPQTLRATGFLARSWYRYNRNTWMEGVVEHTGKAFVGMTFNCAKCHDHMYDPISQKDYYRFRAIFEPYDVRMDPIAGNIDTAADGLARVVDANQTIKTYLLVRGDERNVKKDEEMLPGVPTSLGGKLEIAKIDLPPAAYYAGLNPDVRKSALAASEAAVAAAEKELAQSEAGIATAQAAYTAAAIPPLDRNPRLINLAGALRVAVDNVEIARLKLNAARAERASLDARLAADDAKYATPPRPDAQPLALAAGHAVRQLSIVQGEARLQEAQNALTTAQLSLKGATNAKSLKTLTDAAAKVIEQRTALDASKKLLDKPSPEYAPITKLYPATSTGRRTALAKWITSRDNPLAARVAANHLWMRHFGAPLVSTVFDFGLNGKPPTNPALLDWLAVELMDRGWSMKALHRLMVTSATYRMQSDVAPTDNANQQTDPDNIYLWHANVKRMEAEIVRDSVLFLGGNLDLAASGPDIDPEQGLTSNRRSLYFRHALDKQMTFLTVFDVANPNECYQRDQSVMPQQALALANSSIALAESRRLASTLTQQVGSASSPMKAFVSAAFIHVLSREPSNQERKTCEQFLVDQAERLKNPATLTLFAADSAAGVAPSKDPNQRARENLVLVLINHNDFVTIR